MVIKPGTVLADEENKTLRILVVEDNPGDVIIIRELLKASGTKFSLANATSLKESLFLISSNHYDVMIVDLGLPDSMGINTIRELLNNDVPQPVIVMTGLDDEEVALA
jgi:DNA-binding response OmpR family regulator